MNKQLISIFAGLLVTASSLAQDLPAPRPATNRACRVFLYINGSTRALDYNDVIKVHALDDNAITFETIDGVIVVHHGPFTLIGPKTEFAEHIRGGRVRFFDAK
jgi:hypothetical protein